ncbi:MAG: CPBP family intramembrane metalloprotease [Chloroflexi bacterium]|nr:CPBP family intramembrane metalloprotease [Chloroflexota bacterium]
MDIPGSQPENPAPPSWLDLILYILLGFGLFIAAGLALRGVLKSPSLLASATIYALNISIFTGTVYVVGVRRGLLSWKTIGFAPPVWHWSYLALAVGITILFLPIRTILALVVQLLVSGNLQNLVDSARLEVIVPGGFTWGAFLVTLVMAGILAPIAEELFFRGAIYGWFRQRFGLWTAVLISSAIFAIGHADALAVVVSSFVLGIVNALVYERYRSIWAPIAIHAFNNTLALLVVYTSLAFTQGIK